MVECKLFGVRDGSLVVRVGEVRRELVEGRGHPRQILSEEGLGLSCRLPRAARVVVLEDESDVVPVLRLPTRVRGGRLGEEEPGEPRHVDLDVMADSADRRCQRMWRKV